MVTANTSFNESVAPAALSFSAALNALVAGGAAWSAAVTSMTGEAFAQFMVTMKAGVSPTAGSVFSVYLAEELDGKYAGDAMLGADDANGSSTTAVDIALARTEMRLLTTLTMDGAATAVEMNRLATYYAPRDKFKICIINDDAAVDSASSGNGVKVAGYKAQGVTV